MKSNKKKNIFIEAKQHKELIMLMERICTILIFIFLLVIIYSFKLSSREIVTLGADESQKSEEVNEWKRTIKRPRLQVENVDSFNNLVAEKGHFVSDDELLFENATMTSTLGTLEAEKVTVTEDFSNISVTGNPKLIIYPETTEKLTE